MRLDDRWVASDGTDYGPAIRRWEHVTGRAAPCHGRQGWAAGCGRRPSSGGAGSLVTAVRRFIPPLRFGEVPGPPVHNLSHLPPDLSDLMCCIVTGAESIKRALFTDGDVVRSRYRRPMLLTGIDVGVIRPDLAERLLPLRLVRPRVRRTEAELWTEYAEILPVILGSLLDLTVKVRAAQADTPTDLRMADFAHLCAQLDTATGFGALAAYRASLDDLNDDVIEGDLLAQTVLQHVAGLDEGAEVRMTSSEWLHCRTSLYGGEECRPLPKGWPATGKVLSDRLKRLQPTLAARVVLIDWGRTSSARYIEMTRPPLPPQNQQEAAF